jgi:beta-galactoside alpha-2,3-sialyltransferase (sialyltransferase 4A)
MKANTFRHLVALIVAVGILLFLVPLPAAAQGRGSSKPEEFGNLETSSRGSLQRRLQTAFPDSFRKGVDIFWEPRDGWVSAEGFDWWVYRLTETDREGVSREAAERLFAQISMQSPVFSSSDRRQISAVVGASGNLLDSDYGGLIDAHDVVIRVNRAPTDEFNADVGEKTTHHVMWPRELEEHQFDRRAFLLMNPITANTEDVFGRIVFLVGNKLRWEPRRVRIIHPEFVKYLHENWTEERGEYPSTGFIALMIAVPVCDEVDVFGFGADAQGRWDRYYEDVAEDLTGFHPAELEGRLRMEMEEKGILKVFRGIRPLVPVQVDVAELD